MLLTTQWLFGIWETTKKKKPPRLPSSAPNPFSISSLSFTPRGVGGNGGSEMLVWELGERWGWEARRQFSSDDQWDLGIFGNLSLLLAGRLCK